MMFLGDNILPETLDNVAVETYIITVFIIHNVNLSHPQLV